MNSEGWMLIGPKLYQLLAPLIIGVIEVSGKISNPINRMQNILYKNISITFNFLR